MAFSEDDLLMHNYILEQLSDLFSKISENLDLIIVTPHRNQNLAWAKVFEININRIRELRTMIAKSTEHEHIQLELHGLVGEELRFKYELIENSNAKFQEHFNSYLSRPKKTVRPTLRKALIRFLSLINPYLDSLSTIFPVAGVIKEFKEFIENSVGVSEKY